MARQEKGLLSNQSNMYIHGSFINNQGDEVTVHVVTHADRSREVVIGDESDGGALLYFTADPVETESCVNDTFDHLLCSSARIRLLARAYVPDFFCASARDAVVNIYKGSRCVFAGFIEPQAYSQPYNSTYDEVELTCVDALAALQYSAYRGIGSKGVSYAGIKATAEIRTFQDLLVEILGGIGAQLDIVGGHGLRCLYDGSKALDDTAANRYALPAQLAISELLFLGDDEDEVWKQDEVLCELLKYLNLHVVQEGTVFYVFDWATVKGMDTIVWHDLLGGIGAETDRVPPVDITADTAWGTETELNLGETYNRIRLTCDVKSMDSVVESPLDDELLTSPYVNKQKYMTEYSSDGEGRTALDAFGAMVRGEATAYANATVTDWYVQVKQHPSWTFYGNKGTDLLAVYAQDGMNQQELPNALRDSPGAAILSIGKVEKKGMGRDNSLKAKIEMTDCLVVSVNGNGKDAQGEAYPTEATIRENIPYAVYKGSVTGGVFSPSNAEAVNYIVISGRVVLNPLMDVSRSYYNQRTFGFASWDGHTVPSRDNKDGRYYTQQWYRASTPKSLPVWDMPRNEGFVPFTGTGPELYKFNHSSIGDGTDQVSKVSVLACMLVIGNRCVVEKPKGEDLGTGVPGTGHGMPDDFVWMPYKERGACRDDDEYYQQCFFVGFNPKIGDMLVGAEFDIQNNIDYTLGLDIEGTAIPVRFTDRVSGPVRFMVLGPVNMLWDVVTRRHKTFFRHTKWSVTSVPLLAHVSSIIVKSFEVKVVSDNAGVNTGSDKDLCYISDTREEYVNPKDDIEFKISSALSVEECTRLGVPDVPRLSTPTNVATNMGLVQVYDHTRGQRGKPERLYVDSYWREYHAPRVLLTQRITERTAPVSLFAHYRHPAMDKEFFVQGIGRNLMEGYAELTLKELDQ